jgi:hypothetical protein
MLKHHGLLLAAAAAAVIAVTAAAGVTAASASPSTRQAVHGTEYVQIMSTSPTSGLASAIAHGVFTATGQAQLGEARLGKIVFPGGTIILTHRAGRGTAEVDPRTCLDVISQPGTYQITAGTGRYAGISGDGTYQLSLIFVAGRSHGQCSSAKPPVARQELLRLSGPVRL